MISKKIIFKSINGMHLNFAAEVCKSAVDYKASIKLITANTNVNAKSILNILGSKIKCGDEVEVVCDGNDEEKALEAITYILQKEKIDN